MLSKHIIDFILGRDVLHIQKIVNEHQVNYIARSSTELVIKSYEYKIVDKSECIALLLAMTTNKTIKSGQVKVEGSADYTVHRPTSKQPYFYDHENRFLYI